MHAITLITPTTQTPPEAPPETPPEQAQSALPPRFALAPEGSSPALLDGAWWPYSRDLAVELPPLIALLDKRWDRITHVTVNPAHWPEIPHKVPVPGHVVKAGWFAAEQDPHKLMLLSYRTGRWDLLVVPPETDPETAAWLMAAATDPRRTSTASRLMDEAGHRAPAADRLTDPRM